LVRDLLDRRRIDVIADACPFSPYTLSVEDVFMRGGIGAVWICDEPRVAFTTIFAEKYVIPWRKPGIPRIDHRVGDGLRLDVASERRTGGAVCGDTGNRCLVSVAAAGLKLTCFIGRSFCEIRFRETRTFK
jgi:hypothetical protein